MNWLHYLLEANLYLAIFYTAYYLFLSKETYYTLNRAYLLLSCVISFGIPVMQLGILKPAEREVRVVNFNFQSQGAIVKPMQAAGAAPQFTWQEGIIYCYLAVAAVLLLVLIVKLYQLIKLARKNKQQTDADYQLVYLNDSTTAFSFFNFLFIGTKADGAKTIIQHELVHIRQKHSADIIFIELLKIINWFNPFIYLLQISLRAIHEYIADEKTINSETDALAYSSFLVNNAYGLSGTSITNSIFNYNLLKKRIIMLNQQRSGRLARLKYLLAAPICAGMLCLSTLAFSKTYGWVDIVPGHTKNVSGINNPTNKPIHHARLLVKQNGVSVLTDKFREQWPDGTIRYYTVNSLSDKDKADLAKIGIVVNVLYDVTIDSIKDKIAPPPPPAPRVRVKLPPPPAAPGSMVVFPAPKIPNQTTEKGYKYAEGGEMVNGKVYLNVIIYEKSGTHKQYFKGSASPAEITLLREKYGYTFPAKPDFNHFAPPPPPARPVKAADNRPPPPPPFDPAFKDLLDYLGKHVRYPASAFENEETGNVVIQFNLNGDHKITDVKLFSGSDDDFNDEVIRVMKTFPGIIDPSATHPYYLTGVSFNIRSKNGIKLAKRFDKDFRDSENYTCVADIYGFTQDDIK